MRVPPACWTRIEADVIKATLSALNLFTRAGVTFLINDDSMAWKSSLYFEIAAANSAVAAAIAASLMVCLVALGDGGLDAMLAKVSIGSSTGLTLALSFLELSTSRIDIEVAARLLELGPGLERDLEREQDRERGREEASAELSLLLLFILLPKLS
jgi:hypothetical protein